MKKYNFMNRICNVTAMVLLVGAVAVFGTNMAEAADKIQSLGGGDTVYEIDLDEDGVKEEFSFKLVHDGDDYYSYQVAMNGETVAIANELYDIYDAYVQVADIDVTDGYMDMWFYGIGTSDILGYAALYQYQDGELVKLHRMEPEEIDENFFLGNGVLHKVNGDGEFFVKVESAFRVDDLIGNHYDLIPMQLEDGKVSFVNTNTYTIAKLYNEGNKLTVAAMTEFYKKPKEDAKIAFVAMRWEKVKPIKIRRNGTKLYVKFKNEEGKTGWICKDAYDMGPFTDLIWAG